MSSVAVEQTPLVTTSTAEQTFAVSTPKRPARSGQLSGWMSIPGGPSPPSFEKFSKRLVVLRAEKAKCFDTIKQLKEKAGIHDNSAFEEERKRVKAQIDGIKTRLDQERTSNQATKARIQGIREQKIRAEEQIHELTRELGAFDSMELLEKAMDRVMEQFERNSSGSLKSEKRTIEKIKKLEKAKALLYDFHLMQEAIDEVDTKERELIEELRDNNERRKHLSSEYALALDQRKASDGSAESQRAERDKIWADIKIHSTRINAINAELIVFRDAYDTEKKAWEEWKESAKRKYEAKRVAEYTERERRRKERMDAIRNERLKDKISKKRNPYFNEIEVCVDLLRYLKDKAVMQKHEEEERQIRIAMANFNPLEAAPKGFKLASAEVEGFSVDLGKPKKCRKNKNKQQATASPVSSATMDQTVIKRVNHAENRLRQFESIDVEAPKELQDFESVMSKIVTKHREYESHIITGVIDVTSSDDDETEKEEGVEGQKIEASPTAVTGAEGKKSAEEEHVVVADTQ